MILTWPDIPVGSIRWRKQSQQVAFKSAFGSQALETGMPVWRVDLNGLMETREVARSIQEFIDSLDGYKNQIALWNVEHPVPAGTMRGDMSLVSVARSGDTTLMIRAIGQGGNTLLAGDYIGLGSTITQQLVRVTEDAIADIAGVITVNINIPLRNAFPVGTEIVWDKPKALFRQTQEGDGIEITPVFGNAWALSLIEDWRV